MVALVIILWIVLPGLLNYRLARANDRSVFTWVILALLAGWLSTLILLALPAVRGECSECLLPVRWGARRCPHCNAVFEPETENAPVAERVAPI